MPSCIQMITLKNGDTVPCGKCPNCTKRNVSHWSFRLMQQFKADTTVSAYFVTLTYDTKHVPITKKGYMSIRKQDLQLFFKRLRKHHDVKTLKYFAVGEYGGKSERPHYHALIFNATPQTISKAWQIGHIHFGTITEASCGYTLKYMHKQCKIPKHYNDDRPKNFSLKSKGLGLNYITSKTIKWHKADLQNRAYVPLLDGKKTSMPRYYKDKIYHNDERKAISAGIRIKAARADLQMVTDGTVPTNRDRENSRAATIAKHQYSLKQNNKI